MDSQWATRKVIAAGHMHENNGGKGGRGSGLCNQPLTRRRAALASSSRFARCFSSRTYTHVISTGGHTTSVNGSTRTHTAPPKEQPHLCEHRRPTTPTVTITPVLEPPSRLHLGGQSQHLLGQLPCVRGGGGGGGRRLWDAHGQTHTKTHKCRNARRKGCKGKGDGNAAPTPPPLPPSQRH